MKHYRKLILLLFLIVLPWQTRWIVQDILMQSDVTQYGRLSIYVFDVVLIGFLLVSTHLFNPGTWKWVRVSIRRRMLFESLAGVVLLSAVSMFWSLEPRVALFASIHLLLAVWLFVTVVLDKELSINLILAGVSLSLIAPSVLGWLQSASQLIDASTLLGIAAQDPSILGTAVIEHAQGRWLRAYGTFSHPNMFGGFLAVGFVAALGIAARGKEKMPELLLWLSAATMGGVLIMSASRGAWIASIMGVGFLYLGSRSMGWRAHVKRMQKPLLLALTVIVIISLSLGPILSSRFDTTNRLEEKSLSERMDQWSDVSRLLQIDSGTSIVGVGVGNYVFALEEIRPLRNAYAYQPVHNVFALILVELGLMGAVLLLSSVLAIYWLPIKRWRHPSSLLALSIGIVILTLAFTDHYLWTQPSGLYLLALVLAVSFKLGEEAENKVVGVPEKSIGLDR